MSSTNKKKKPSTVYTTTMIGVFVAASGLLGLVKMPTGVPSIALDSTPAYFIAGYLGPGAGGVVGALGHLASAFAGGFPLGWIHLVVSIQMFISCAAFGWIIRKHGRLLPILGALVAAIVLNGILAPLSLGLMGLVPMDIAKGLVGVLTFASAVNAALAVGALLILTKRRTSSIA